MGQSDGWMAEQVLEAIASLLRDETLSDKGVAAGSLALIEEWERRRKQPTEPTATGA